MFSKTPPKGYQRLPLILLAFLTIICLVTVWNPPAGRFSWLLEVGPGLVGVAVLVGTYKKFPMSHLVYVGVFIHMLILIYGGI
jgi:putative membrane protein